MFTLPLYDDNPTRRPSFVTWLLILACVAVFFWQVSLGDHDGERAVYALGVIPAVLFGQAELPPGIAVVPAWASIVTSMFLHGGWMHMLGNMLYLWIFGNNVEDSMGHGRFVVFYLVCGTVGALTQSFIAPGSEVPMIGASGAIAGVLGAYLILHPQANVRVLLVILIFIRLINVPALIVLGFWFAMQFFSGAMTPTDEGGVAVWAHIGGFVAGMALIPFFRHRGVPLFQGAHSQAFKVQTPQAAKRRGSVPEAGNWPPR